MKLPRYFSPSKLILTFSLTVLFALTYLFIFPPLPTPNALADPAPATNPLKPTPAPNISISLNGKTGINITDVQPNGSAKTDSVTVTTTTDNPTGYNTTLSTNSTDTCLKPSTDLATPCSTQPHKIEPATGTLNLTTDPSGDNLSTLTANQWGATLADLSAIATDKGNEKVWFGVPDNGASHPVAIDISTTATTTTGHNQIVTFGAKVNYQLPASTYQNTVVFTAIANFIPAPTISQITPNSGSTTGQTPIVITGTNLDTAHQVFIDFNSNQTEDPGEACAGPANIDSPTQISCTLPTHATTDTYNVIVKTWGGTSTATTPTSDDFTYQTPTTTNQWVKATAANAPNSTATITGDSASDLTVDIDDNMIPVVNQLSNNTYPNSWCNYDEQQWCNAVTVKATGGTKTLAQYKSDPIGTPIAEEDILGYWVYIPRYAYEVQRYYSWNKPVCGNGGIGSAYAELDCSGSNSNQSRFNIHFEKANTPKKIPSPGNATCSTPPSPRLTTLQYTGGINYRSATCGVDTAYGATTGTAWATHPAFSFDKDGSGTYTSDEELNGLWVGKFETTGSVSAPTIKPNLKSQISQTIGVQYDIAKSLGVTDPNATGGNGTTTTQNSHNLATANTHQQKNSEWGAVAYLATSIYGSGGARVRSNAAYKGNLQNGNGSTGYGITGCGPVSSSSDDQYTITDSQTTGAVACTYNSVSHSYQTDTGILASTTQNVYGVYDMAGGAWEYVMAYYGYNNTSYMATLPPNSYIDNYGATADARPDWASSSANASYNLDHCAWTATPTNPTTTQSLFPCGGHANYETSVVQSVSSDNQSWGSDYSYFAYSGRPWFLRGGASSNGTGAGLFASTRNDGSANSSYGFRISLSAF